MNNDAIQRINTHRLVSTMQHRVSALMSNSEYLFLKGTRFVKRAVTEAISKELLDIQMMGAIDQWQCDIEADSQGRLVCNILFQPTRSVQYINATIAISRQLKGHFYAKPHRDGWQICADKDIYCSTYVPMIVSIGETLKDWKLFTEEEIVAKGVHLDEIMTWTENIELPSK